MSRQLLMGLDVGGGSGRCLLFDADDGSHVSACRAWSHPPAPDTGGLGYDLDYAGIWQRLGEAAHETLTRAGARPQDVVGVATTAMRFGMVVVDADGRPVYGGPNRDARAVVEGLTLAAQHGAELAALGGHWPIPIAGAPRLQWLRAQGGSAWEQAHRVLSLSDWLALGLCGEMASERSQAGASLLFDLQADDWDWDWIDRFELPRELFPELAAPGTRLGGLTAEAAEHFGLAAGTPVAVGGADTQCGLLGSGVAAPGAVGIVAGTSAPVQMVTDSVRLHPEARLWSGAHVVPGQWVLESNGGSLGEALDWLAHVLFPDAPAPAARALAEAARAEPGARGMLSSVGVQVFDAREMGIPIGTLAFSHLAAPAGEEGRASLLRSVVEGAAFSLRANLEQILATAGRDTDSVHLTGGLSRSGFYAGLLADVLGRTLRVAPSPEGTALGAALCAGTGAGVYADLTQAASAAAARTTQVEPDPARSASYDDTYALWQDVRAARAPADVAVRNHTTGIVIAATHVASGTRGPRPRPRILVTADLDPAARDALAELGDVEYAPFRERMRLLTGEALVKALDGVGVFITEVDVVDAASVARLPDLRVVASCRGDAVNVDLEGCTALGVPVLNAPGRNADAVADLSVAFLLMLARKLVEANAFLREPGGEAGDMGRMGRAFGTLRGRELWRKTVGLVGLGAVGRGVAKRLRAFGARVLVHDPFLDDDAVRLADAEPASFDQLLAESDFVSLHAPVTEASEGLIGAAELARMKPGAGLVNTARAALVDEDALLEAVESGHLGGAALDVFWVEPPASDHPLLAHERVLATPHVGGNTEDVAAHQGAIIAADLTRLLDGERPHHLLNPAVWDAFDWSSPRPELDAKTLAALGRKPGPAVTDLQKEKKPMAPRTTSPPPSQPATPASGPADSETVEKLRTILDRFVSAIVESGALEPYAAGKDVTLHFRATDVDLAFWLRLRDGRVSAGPGAPDEEPEVELKLAADVLDGMFTGRVNAMQAAMDGRLSFAGDTAKAMSLQEFQGDLARLYREARDAVGDPGDLTALAAPTQGSAAAVADDDPRHELIRVMDELYAQQLITATGGNVSVRVPGEDALWITPSQLFKGDLSPEALVRIDLDGKALDEGARSASSERLMHCAVYRTRKDAGAVIHAHAPHATILANTDLPFLPISTEAAFFDNLPRIPFVMPGTQELADAVADGMRESWAVLMKNHGLLVGGRSLRRAADMVEIIERSSEVILGCYAVGREPPVLPDDVVATLRKMGDLVA
jgi:autoinducer 2 (AI-2) kinase